MRVTIQLILLSLCLNFFCFNKAEAKDQQGENKKLITFIGNDLSLIENPENPHIKYRLVNFLNSHIDPKDYRKVKITASILALTLGPFGVHRLYLGTTPLIPVVYVATVGGGVGILPFIDFVAIVFSKDITPYMNNDQIFMWVKK